MHRLGVGWLLQRTLASTNPIESRLSTVERVARNMKRWRAGDLALRWTATGLLEAEKKFRRVKGYRELELLLRLLNPQCLCQRCQAHRELSALLTQQVAVAEFTTPTISAGLGISEPYATDIRAGRRVPHRRHWPTLARLVGVSPDEERIP